MQKVKETKAETRVRLAKDVLKQLRAKKIKTAPGAYIKSHDYYSGKKLEKCEVCAAGALAVACCGVPKKVNDDMAIFSDVTVEIRDCLSPLFSLAQLAMIEAAFEGRSDMPLSDFSKTKLDKAKNFGVFAGAKDKYAEDWESPVHYLIYTPQLQRRQLRLIMQNIIDNGGTFKP